MSDLSKKELRANLVAALRSGHYQQARGKLCTVLDARDPARVIWGYCCLGIASVLVEEPLSEDDARKRGEGMAHGYQNTKFWQENYSDSGGDYTFLQGSLLPRHIQNKYGFSASTGAFYVTEEAKAKFPRLNSFVTGCTSALTTLNDAEGWSLKEIADLIEFEPKGMFTD